MRNPAIRSEWAVFPLFGIQEGGKCACGNESCKDVGKHPAYPWGRLEKGQQVEGRAGCGYGIATGERSGIFVLDFDTMEAISEMDADPSRPLPATLMVETGRGVHLYFKCPGFRVRNSASELAPGVDVRGDGGYVVAPGSPHKNGKTYSAGPGGTEIAEAPAWLLAWPGLRAAERVARDAGSNAPVPVDLSTERGAKRVGMALAYLEGQPPCIQGQGGSDQLWRVCLHLVRELALPLDACAELLERYNARCEPPWTDAEIWHKLEDARDRSDRPAGGADLVGFVEAAKRAAAESKIAVVSEREAAAEHVYTFDPLKEVVETQYVTKKDGTEEKRKLGKPHVSDLLFDLDSCDEWLGVFRYNEFDNRLYAHKPPFKMSAERGEARLPDEDLTGMRAWFLVKKYANPDKTDLDSAASFVAHRNTFHPIRDWLNAMPAPSTRHLDNLAEVLFGDDRPIAQDYVRKQLIAACARVFEPGCRVDTVLTLVGPKGGEKKSTVIEELHRVPGCDVFRTDLPDLRDTQKVGQALEGCWVAELAELASLKKGDVETVKATLTRKVEKYSPKYVKGEISRPRCCVFWGSTNEENFLPKADPAFRRRFWPIIMGKRADMGWLAAHRDEIWAEAIALYRAGVPWWFEDEGEADAGRQGVLLTDSWEQGISEALAKPLKGGKAERFLTAKDVYMLVHGLDAKPPTDADIRKVHNAMAGLSYRKCIRKGFAGWVVQTEH